MTTAHRGKDGVASFSPILYCLSVEPRNFSGNDGKIWQNDMGLSNGTLPTKTQMETDPSSKYLQRCCRHWHPGLLRCFSALTMPYTILCLTSVEGIPKKETEQLGNFFLSLKKSSSDPAAATPSVQCRQGDAKKPLRGDLEHRESAAPHSEWSGEWHPAPRDFRPLWMEAADHRHHGCPSRSHYPSAMTISLLRALLNIEHHATKNRI